jgi:hypothetical protein
MIVAATVLPIGLVLIYPPVIHDSASLLERAFLRDIILLQRKVFSVSPPVRGIDRESQPDDTFHFGAIFTDQDTVSNLTMRIGGREGPVTRPCLTPNVFKKTCSTV